MGRSDYYLKCGWNAICDMCGMKFKNVDLTMDWRGLWCCSECWSPKQPQLNVRGVEDNQAVYPCRPEGSDVYISTDITPEDL